MRQIYIAQDNISAQMMKDYLASRGIKSMIKGELLIGAVGEIPANAFPTVWVIDNEDYDGAISWVKKFEAGLTNEQLFENVWKCERCDELIEAQFTQCWNCGRDRV